VTLEQEDLKCYVISARGAPVFVLIGTRGEAAGKLIALVNAAYRALPKEEFEALRSASNAANYRSMQTFMKHFQKWRIDEVEYAIGIKP